MASRRKKQEGICRPGLCETGSACSISGGPCEDGLRQWQYEYHKSTFPLFFQIYIDQRAAAGLGYRDALHTPDGRRLDVSFCIRGA